ncbi:MAG: adenylate/guanylate cyclase domain-containing protein [Pseudomonadota bacterium]|nr:adenylate/guanylate cyclase domain-containing protein [Pseudomonadota bacterium]
MADTEALWTLLLEAAEPQAAAAIKHEVETAADVALCRINALAFAAARGLDEDAAIGAFVRAAQLGLFDMSWSALCPGCGGVLESGAALRTLNRHEYFCSLCIEQCEPTLDQRVEVTFTVSPRVRRIAAHDPDSMNLPEYMRQIFWSSAIDLPPDLGPLVESVSLDSLELEPGEKASLSLSLPPMRAMVFDPITHTSMFLHVSGEETSERRALSLIFSDEHAHSGTVELRPGPVRIALDNRARRRTLPAVWLLNDAFHEIFTRRRPFLTATRVFSNQSFREIYRNGTLDSEQRFKITNLTFLFTDLRGSTALYDRVGDLAAFDLVRSHFGALIAAVTAEGGAVVKTIGDAVMATFASPERGLRAAMRMRAAMREINQARGADDLALNIGLHEGPCLAVMLDDRQDYFGQSVNIAARVQGLADPRAVLATKGVAETPEVASLLKERGYRAASRESALKGVSEAFTIYAISEEAA